MTHGKYTTYNNHGCRCGECVEAKSAYMRGLYEKNRQRKLTYQRQYTEANRDAVRERDRKYRESHREEYRQGAARWRENNPDRAAEHNRNRDKAMKLLHNRIRYARQRRAVIIPFTDAQLRARWEYYGSKCWMCGNDATQSDHVKPLAKGGAHMLSNLRPACRPCNGGKKDRWPL